jgi:hypothetical protein
MDRLEGVPYLYRRERIWLDGDTVAEHRPWAYVYNRSVDGHRDIGGVWPSGLPALTRTNTPV